MYTWVVAKLLHEGKIEVTQILKLGVIILLLGARNERKGAQYTCIWTLRATRCYMNQKQLILLLEYLKNPYKILLCCESVELKQLQYFMFKSIFI